MIQNKKKLESLNISSLYTSDIVIIGGGLSGIQYAINVSKENPNLKINLFTKQTLEYCNSYLAQGGIAASMNSKESIASHISDTIIAGRKLNDKYVAKKIIEYGHTAITQLESEGVVFDKLSINKELRDYDLAKEGGHCERRIYHVKDKTGKEIIESLRKEIKKFKNINIFNYHVGIDLLINKNSNLKEVNGVYILDEKTKRIILAVSNIVVLATGGAGKIYRFTSNLDVSTGDGIAMSLRAGASIANMEFYQFHPTLLLHKEVNNFLITEAMRGEGAILKNAETEKPFMEKYSPIELSLSPRDIVSRAIFSEIESGKKNYVFLDITHKGKKFLKNRFSTIYNKLLSLGIDISKNMIPVIPAAHYLCGGVLTDISGKTNVRNLYVIGEAACTNFHGSNRLASNSLLEAIAMAYYAAKESIKNTQKSAATCTAVSIPDIQLDNFFRKDSDPRRISQINAHWMGIRSEMNSYAGIIRTESGLKDLIKLLKLRSKIINDFYNENIVTRETIELRNIVLIAEIIAKFSLKRKLSLGTHFREDAKKTYSFVPKKNILTIINGEMKFEQHLKKNKDQRKKKS